MDQVRRLKSLVWLFFHLISFIREVMVSECALCLLTANRDKLTFLGREGGILTPMSAFGSTILERLVATGKLEISSGELVDGGATESKEIRWINVAE